jgi:hypothetical protein
MIGYSIGRQYRDGFPETPHRYDGLDIFRNAQGEQVVAAHALGEHGMTYQSVVWFHPGEPPREVTGSFESKIGKHILINTSADHYGTNDVFYGRPVRLVLYDETGNEVAETAVPSNGTSHRYNQAKEVFHALGLDTLPEERSSGHSFPGYDQKYIRLTDGRLLWLGDLGAANGYLGCKAVVFSPQGVREFTLGENDRVTEEKLAEMRHALDLH